MSTHMVRFSGGATVAGDGSFDSWPKDRYNMEWDGEFLMQLDRAGENPFKGPWDIKDLIKEVEFFSRTSVIDILLVTCGRHHFGFHMTLQGKPDVVVRLSRADVNHPGRDQWAIADFEIDTCDILKRHATGLIRRSMYHRDGTTTAPHGLISRGLSVGISRRQVSIFERTPGEVYEGPRWWYLTAGDKMKLLDQAGNIGAAVFNSDLPSWYVDKWLVKRAFAKNGGTPEPFAVPIQPTREFCLAFLTNKLRNKVKPYTDARNFIAARDTVLDILPRLLPKAPAYDESKLYRFVIDPEDYGISNMMIDLNCGSTPRITSVFDWEDVNIVPAILADPGIVLTTTVCLDEDGKPSFRGVIESDPGDPRGVYEFWANDYFESFLAGAPDCRYITHVAPAVRHLYRMVNEWNGEDPDNFLSDVLMWACEKEAELDRLDGLRRP